MKNTTSMLDYCKAVLQAVSFDERLFSKEYIKSIQWLSKNETQELKLWIQNNQSNWIQSKN